MFQNLKIKCNIYFLNIILNYLKRKYIMNLNLDYSVNKIKKDLSNLKDDNVLDIIDDIVSM